MRTRIIFLGEAPGKNEDEQGEPFVGAAGRILDELLEHIELDRKKIYITNILKCRPPNNDEPTDKEKTRCAKWLYREIAGIRPKVIVTLGVHAAEWVSKRTKTGFIIGKPEVINTLIGKITVISLLHPACALYNPNKKPEMLKQFEVIKKYV